MRSTSATIVAVVLVTVVAYLPALRGGFVWDDDQHVTRNATLESREGLRRIWLEPHSIPQYYPLVHTTFWIEHRLWGLDPFGYHLVNVLLHAANAVLVGLALSRLGVAGGWVAAALFALHPVEAESVAWVTERKNVLSGLFYLAALLSWLRLPGEPRNAPGDGPPWRRLGTPLALYACALLSKTVTVSLPVALLIIAWWRRRRPSRREVAALGAMLLAGAALGTLTIRLEASHVGAYGEEWDLTLVERCLVAGRAFWFYLEKLVWPQPLAFIYERWKVDPRAVWQFLFPATAVAFLLGLGALRRRIGRGPLAAMLFYVVTLSPALGFFNVFPMRYSFVADHFAYLASLGPLALGVASLTTAARRLAPSARRVAAVAAGGWILALGTLTWAQASRYRDEETLWRATIERSPRAWMARYNLANLLRRRGERMEAMARYEEALRLKPDLLDAAVNLSNLLAEGGRVDEAIERLSAALGVDPDHAMAQQNLATLYYRRGDVDAAIRSYTEALRLDPSLAAAHYGLGVALARLGRLDEAVSHYREALRVDPVLAPARHNLGVALATLGRPEEAIEQFSEALRLDPDLVEAHYNLAVALSARGRAAAAIVHYEAALRLRPDLAEARQGLERARRQAESEAAPRP